MLLEYQTIKLFAFLLHVAILSSIVDATGTNTAAELRRRRILLEETNDLSTSARFFPAAAAVVAPPGMDNVLKAKSNYDILPSRTLGLRSQRRQQDVNGRANIPGMMYGLGRKFYCDSPSNRGPNDRYSGHSSCFYEDSPYPGLGGVTLGCFCPEAPFIEPSVDCHCWIAFPGVIDAEDQSTLYCRTVSIVPTDPSDGIFQLQYDCSNYFRHFPDIYSEVCAGRDQDGNCFDIHSVPNPSDLPVVTGSFSELTCIEDPIPETLPEPLAGRFQCNSPVNPPPGFPYPGTDSFIILVCDSIEPSEACDCFVNFGFIPRLHPVDCEGVCVGTTMCNECSIIPNGDNSTYQISFDCSNFYDVGDCVGVDENGDCVSASSELPEEEEPGPGSCLGGVVSMPCSSLLSSQTCSVCNPASCSDIWDSCDEHCNTIPGCGCVEDAGACFRRPSTIQCSGTANVDCSDYITPSSCASHAAVGCAWVLDDVEPSDGRCPETIPINFDAEIGTFVLGSTVGASANLPSIGRCGGAGGEGSPTLWYSFETEAPGYIAISTCSGQNVIPRQFDTVISVFLETQLGAQDPNCGYVCIGESDNHGLGEDASFCDSDLQSFLIIFAWPLQTYYVAVSGSGPNDSGDFLLALVDPYQETPPDAP